MYHDRLNLPVRGSRRHGIQFTGNRSMLAQRECLTPRSLSFGRVEDLTEGFLDVFLDDVFFVLRDATLFANAH